MRKIWKSIVPALVICILLSACGNGGGKTGFNVAPPDSNSQEPSLEIESADPETNALEEPSSSVPESPSSTPDSDPSSTPATDTVGEAAEDDVLEIGEKMFLTQINDMRHRKVIGPGFDRRYHGCILRIRSRKNREVFQKLFQKWLIFITASDPRPGSVCQRRKFKVQIGDYFSHPFRMCGKYLFIGTCGPVKIRINHAPLFCHCMSVYLWP